MIARRRFHVDAPEGVNLITHPQWRRTVSDHAEFPKVQFVKPAVAAWSPSGE